MKRRALTRQCTQMPRDIIRVGSLLVVSAVLHARLVQSQALLTDPSGELSQCSCDCCRVEERLPSERIVLPSGQELKHKCMHVLAPVDTSASERCPDLCKDGLHATDLVNFCSSACNPLAATVGAMCQRTQVDSVGVSQWGPTGVSVAGAGTQIPAGIGGTSSANALGGVSGSSGGIVGGTSGKPSWELEVEQRRLQDLKAAEKNEREKEIGQVSTWRLHALAEGRLRAQAAASVANAMAAGEQVRAAVHAVKRDTRFLGKLTGISDADHAVDNEAEMAALANATAAKEAAASATAMVQKVESDAPLLLANTNTLAANAIRQTLGGAAAAEAKAYAERMGWDKPSFYPKLYAFRAGEPAAQAAAVSLRRVQEYEAGARALERQAQLARARAAQAPPVTAQGWELNPQAKKQRSENLLRRARQLEADKHRYHSLANDARDAATHWQGESNKAVEIAWHDYVNAHPAPPA